MCGIAGAVNHNNKPISLKQMKSMADAIRHRGPDDEGFYVKKNVGLAFRRLSIIDLTPAGHQPMTNENGTIYLIFNGEIYNFLELKPILEEMGHRFHSNTDTEVIIHAYEEFGIRCLDKLKGMFAFALWDENQQQLFCARDRFGIKPLYYLQTNSSFYFGSEVKAINAVYKKPTELNYSALSEYFTFQNILSDQTLFKNINLLPAGHHLLLSNNKIKITKYWDPIILADNKIKLSSVTEEIRTKFEQAVVNHLISDVPVGSHLSGGMDSGSIVAVASKYIPHLLTFTGGFDTTGASGIETFFDERKDAEIIARHFNSSHYEMVIHAGDMSWIMPKLIWHLEDLRVGMCYQNFYINQLASKFVKVVLAGTGGDELFAGYPWRYQLIKELNNPIVFNNSYFKYWTRLIPDEEKPNAFTESTWKKMKDYSPRTIYNSIMENTINLSPVNRALYFEIKTFLHGLLIVEDKVSSAHSLESRVPFLDNDLVDLALTIPLGMKLKNGLGKYSLRKALRPLLPKEIINNKKQGFSAPEETWYRGKAYEYVRSILLSNRCVERGIFRRDYLNHIIEHHHKKLKNYRLLIWSLLSFEWWNRIFIDNNKESTVL